MSDVTRILLADDHAMVRRVIRALLTGAGGIEVVGEAGDGEEVVVMAEKLQPDIVIMDVSMPGQNGLRAAMQIRERKLSPRILILSMHNSPGLARQALNVGAQGYVLKRQATQELLTAIEHVTRGETFFSPALGVDPAEPG